MKKFGIITGIIISILVLFMYRSNFRFFDLGTMENKLLDMQFDLRGKTTPGDEVVIVAIDEKTLDKLERWPFPRRYFAEAVENLNSWGVQVIAFDMIFSENDIYSGTSTVDYIQDHIQDIVGYNTDMSIFFAETRLVLDGDYHLAMELRETPKAVLGYFFHLNPKNIAHLTPEEQEEYMIKLDEKSSFNFIYNTSQYSNKDLIRTGVLPEPNIDIISDSADGYGFFNVFIDPDGTIRWTQLVMKYSEEDKFFPSLALEVARTYLDVPLGLSIGEEGAFKITLGDIDIPVSPHGQMLINYRGGLRTFPYYSFVDVCTEDFSDLDDDFDPFEAFGNKIVLIGTAATGTYDLRVTPFSSEIPGMEINANIIDNILHENFMSVPRWEPFLMFVTVIIFGILLGFVLPRVNAWQGAIVSLVLLVGWLAYVRFMFLHKLAWIGIMPPFLTIFLAYITLTLIRYIVVERAGRQIKSAFEFYVPEAVVDEIIKDPAKLTLGGERKDISVLFSDIAGFTTFSENLTPEELVHVLNEYLTAMTEVVFAHRGLLDKYIGDAIMAVYGAPLPQPDHHLKACLTALDMMSELKILQKKWEGEGKQKLEIRIGVNSGFAAVGNMGSEKRFDYTVMGDNVNLASRLEGINKIYGTNIIISESTYEHVYQEILCRELDLVRVKGKTKPVKIYEVIGRKNGDQESQKMVHLFEKALIAARERDWDVAMAIFKETHEQFPDDAPTTLYLDRITEARKNPPHDDWDGVFDIKTK